MRANFFTIRLPKDPIYDYMVKITPDPTKGVKERIFQLLMQHPSVSPFARSIAHDRSDRLVSSRELEQPLEVTIAHTDEGAPAANARPYQVEIMLRDTLDPNKLTRWVVFPLFCNVVPIHPGQILPSQSRREEMGFPAHHFCPQLYHPEAGLR